MLIDKNNYNFKLTIAFHSLISIIFLIFNPFYALFFSSAINIVFKKINFKFFSILFALSFALIFTNRDPQTGGDVLFYITRYSGDIDFFDSLTVNGYVEPIWEIYTRVLSVLFRNNIDMFVVFNYFLFFYLLSIFSKLFSKEYYVIVLFVILYFNFAILFGIYQVWRTSFAILISFIGIYSLSPKVKLLSYFAPLIHIIATPIILIGNKLNYKLLILISVILLILFSHILDRLIAYSELESGFSITPFFLFISSAILIIKYLKLISLSQSENRILFALIVYSVLPLFYNFNYVLAVIYDRLAYIFMFFGTIMIARLVISHKLISALFISFYFIYRAGFTSNNIDSMNSLINLGDGRPFYIFNGIYLMITNYDLNRWSDYMLVNSI